jgi:2-polyprenyl-6-methoxyphenol hydroxylase-like FAD-dependent oxidoreductase
MLAVAAIAVMTVIHYGLIMKLNIVIVGAGLGGLCLAQGLRKAGVGVAVFERDASACFRDQGYRVSLKADGVEALRDCLPERLFDLCAATSIRPATRLAVLDHRLRPKFVKPLPPFGGFGVNRLTLREILLSGLDVRFGKTCTHAEGATAHFADGTHATGDLLVGADGTNSVVRATLLPDAALDDLGSFVYGRTPMLDDLPDVLVDTFNSLSGPDGIRFGVATCRRSGALPDTDVTLTDIPGYLSWTVSGLTELPATAAALHARARGALEGWHAAVRRIVDAAEIPGTFRVDVRSARPVDPWPTTNITLLGDAIHTMSPGRGDGANQALLDARSLCRALAEDGLAGTARYEAEMLPRGLAAVAASREAPFLSRHR